MISVLFVCLGNICRSPMAEAVFQHYVKESNLNEEIHIDSAGTGDWHIGNSPHIGTRSILDEAGISYEGIQARQVSLTDFTHFQYIVAMDDSNFHNLTRLAGKDHAQIYRLVDFIPHTTYKEIPDPYFTGDFAETYELVTAGCRGLLDHIKKENSL